MLKSLKNTILAIFLTVVGIAGYGITMIIFTFIFGGLLYGACLLVIETFFNPSIEILLADAIVAVAFYALIIFKPFKSSLKEFWVQFRRNL